MFLSWGVHLIKRIAIHTAYDGVQCTPQVFVKTEKFPSTSKLHLLTDQRRLLTEGPVYWGEHRDLICSHDHNTHLYLTGRSDPAAAPPCLLDMLGPRSGLRPAIHFSTDLRAQASIWSQSHTAKDNTPFSILDERDLQF